MSPGTEDPRIKTGRSIRCAARIRPLEYEPEPVSSPMDKRTGASPSCLKSVSRTPVFEPYPFGCADCEADAAAFRRARSERFSSSDKSSIARFRFSVKKMSQKSFSERRRGRSSRWRPGLPLPVPIACERWLNRDSQSGPRRASPDSDGPEPPSLDRRADLSAVAADPFVCLPHCWNRPRKLDP